MCLYLHEIFFSQNRLFYLLLFYLLLFYLLFFSMPIIIQTN